MRRLIYTLVLILVASSCSTGETVIAEGNAGSGQSSEAVIDDAQANESALLEREAAAQAPPTTPPAPPTTTSTTSTTAAPSTMAPPESSPTEQTKPIDAPDLVAEEPELPADLAAMMLDETDFDGDWLVGDPDFYPGRTPNDLDACGDLVAYDEVLTLQRRFRFVDADDVEQFIRRAADSQTAQMLITNFADLEPCFQRTLDAQAEMASALGEPELEVSFSIQAIEVPGADAASSWELSVGDEQALSISVAVGDVVTAVNFSSRVYGPEISRIDPGDAIAIAVEKIAAAG